MKIVVCALLAVVAIMLVINMIKVIVKAVQKKNNKQHHLSEDVMRRLWLLDYDYLGLWHSSPLDKVATIEPESQPESKTPICEMNEDGQLMFRNDVFKDLTIETERLIDDDSKY